MEGGSCAERKSYVVEFGFLFFILGETRRERMNLTFINYFASTQTDVKRH